jgi:N-acyl-D-amino-acid deacylase
MQSLGTAVLVGSFLLSNGHLCAEDRAPPNSDAVTRGLAIVQKAAVNYPTHRQCFSCHHQTLPLLALDEVRKAGRAINEKLVQSQAEFTHKAFADKLAALEAGEGVGGRTLTVGYGLWTLDLAHWKSDATTTAMVTYLLKNQEADGHFPRHSLRPPMSESLVTTTVLAAHFMRKYAAEPQREAVAATVAKAQQWLASAKLEGQEDYAFRLWGLKLLGAEEQSLDEMRTVVLARQRPDGGWSQTPEMESDAYATGQTLFALREAGLPISAAEYARGVKFLRETQKEDGSWLVETRAKPVQVFFDNDDPHGKSQFISVSATAWAIAALAGAP